MAIPTSTLNLSPIDFCGKQVMAFNEAFYTSTFMNPALGELLTVVPGIKAKKQIVILGLIDLVGRTAQLDTCAPDESAQRAPSTQKQWDPAYIEDRFRECWKDLLNKFTVWGLKNNIKKADLTGTDFANFLEERILDGLKQSIYRITWFADKQAALVSNGGVISSNVTLSDGSSTAMDIRYINGIDGLWDQFFAIGAAHPEQRQRISRNYGGVVQTPGPIALVASTTGGTLAAGAKFYVITAVNVAGQETVKSNEVTVTTTGSTSSVAFSGYGVKDAVSYNLYKGTTSGAENNVQNFLAGQNIVDAGAAGTTQTPPAGTGIAPTFVNQAFTAQDTKDQVITNILQTMIDNADTRLSSDATAKLYVTKSVADQYRRERRYQYPGVEVSYMRTEQGWQYLELSGVPIVVLDFEDRFIRMFFNQGTYLYLPHRIYMATIDNVQLGVEEEDTMTMIDAFYDQRTKEYFLDTGYTIDAKVIEDYRIALAY